MHCNELSWLIYLVSWVALDKAFRRLTGNIMGGPVNQPWPRWAEVVWSSVGVVLVAFALWCAWPWRGRE